MPGSITRNTSNAGAHISWNQWSSTQDYWAQTSFRCDNGRYVNGDVKILANDATMTYLTVSQRTRVFKHEIGHAYGLGEIGYPSSCDVTPKVMWQGTRKWTCGWSGNPPWPADVNPVVNLYS